jgi:hypothetical protein
MINYGTETVDKRNKIKIIEEVNKVAKSYYKFYTAKSGIIVPATMDAISVPTLFTNSIMIFDNWKDYPWLDNCIVDPAELGHLFKTIPKSIIEDDKGNRIGTNATKDTEYRFGIRLTKQQIEDRNKYGAIKLFSEFNQDEWFEPYIMTSDVKERILNKEIILVYIANNVCTFLNKQLVPALKYSSDVGILCKPIDPNSGIYMMCIQTLGSCWRTYSFHTIINVETI